LEQLKKTNENLEIVIADGGSLDNTLIIAENSGAVICKSECGRGLQLAAGAKLANGKVLIFLHADTLLPANAFELIDEYFSRKNIKIATFRMKFDYDHPLLNLYSWFTRFDSIFTNFGDQVIVVLKSFYDELGGFRKIKIFDDVDFLRKARKKTKVYKLPANVVTSARRFLNKGIIKTQILNSYYILEYLLGTDEEKIYKKYFGENLND